MLFLNLEFLPAVSYSIPKFSEPLLSLQVKRCFFPDKAFREFAPPPPMRTGTMTVLSRA